MATAVVLSAPFRQGKHRGCIARKPFLWRLGCCCPQNGVVRCTAHVHCIAGIPATTFPRRQSIALFLQICLLCAPGGNAHAVERFFVKEELKMEDISDARQHRRLSLNLFPAELSGLVLAYDEAPKTSSSSLGFIGCLMFGLLFWREKQATAANAASLEDVQLCIKKAETVLSSQTRSSIGYKLEEAQLGISTENDILQQKSLQCQIHNLKSRIAEKEVKVCADKHVSETLRHQIRNLTASVEKVKEDCTSLMAHVDKQSGSRQGLLMEIQSVDSKLKCKADEIGSLTITAAEQEQAYNKLGEENVAADSSLDILNNKVLDLQAELVSLDSTLHASNGTTELLVKDLNTAANRNESLEATFRNLFRRLQHERASSEAFIAEQQELLANKGVEVEMLFAELECQQDEIDREVEVVIKLTSERDELDKLFREKKNMIGDLQQALSSELEMLRILEIELSTLHQTLQHEQERNAPLELAWNDNTGLRELMKVSSELEGQIETEHKLTEQLEDELHVAHEALHSLKVKVLDLHDSIQSISSSQAHLQEDLARFSEAHKALNQAVKREKRVTAYARKQLTLTTKTITGENQVMEELHNELKKVQKVIEDSKLQILLQANQFEQAIGTAECLADDVIALQTALKEEQTQQRYFSQKDKVSTTVAKPSRKQGISKLATPKSRRNST